MTWRGSTETEGNGQVRVLKRSSRSTTTLQTSRNDAVETVLEQARLSASLESGYPPGAIMTV